MAAIVAVLLLSLWGAELCYSAVRRASPSARLPPLLGASKEQWQHWLTAPMLRLLERGQLWSRGQWVFTPLHAKLVVLRGPSHTVQATKRYAAGTLAASYATALGSAAVSWAAAEPWGLYIGALCAVILPLSRFKELDKQVRRRRDNILLALPEVLSKLTLLIGAGETLGRALHRCRDRELEQQRHPLYGELGRMCNELDNGVAFHLALESFSRRCAVQEVAMFTTSLMLNYKRGGDRFRLSLQQLAYALWEKRKTVTRTRGEEASSKLVFPLAVIFLVLMVLVGAPAIMMMNL